MPHKTVGEVLGTIFTGEPPSWTTAFTRSIASWVGLLVLTRTDRLEIFGDVKGIVVLISSSLFIGFLISLFIKAGKHIDRLYQKFRQARYGGGVYKTLDSSEKAKILEILDLHFTVNNSYPTGSMIQLPNEYVDNKIKNGNDAAKTLLEKDIIKINSINKDKTNVSLSIGIIELLDNHMHRKEHKLARSIAKFFYNVFPLLIFSIYIVLLLLDVANRV